MSILIVDDSHFMRSYIKEMLNEVGYKNFIEAENGLKAIAMYKIHYSSIVIMDLNMPVLNGIDTLKQILHINPLANVIMCTSMGGQKFISEELIGSGAKEVVTKPNFQRLVSIVNRLERDTYKRLYQ